MTASGDVHRISQRATFSLEACISIVLLLLLQIHDSPQIRPLYSLHIQNMAQEDQIMTDAPLTPGEEPSSPIIDYSPAKVPYNEAFENELMNAMLYASPSDARTPLSSTPLINPTTLPVPLSSELRTYASPLPGVLLTHPNGYYTGGPGPNPSTVAEYAKKFIEENGIEDAGQLERVVEEKIREKLEEAK